VNQRATTSGRTTTVADMPATSSMSAGAFSKTMRNPADRARKAVHSFLSAKEECTVTDRRKRNQFDCATEFRNELLVFLQYMANLLCNCSFGRRRERCTFLLAMLFSGKFCHDPQK
jgi:hypothetical protein